MIKYLMNSDLPVLKIDLEISDEKFNINDIEVLCNDMLPYELKDYVISTKYADEKKSIIDKNILKDFLFSRTLNFSRANAKNVLSIAELPTKPTIISRAQIALACNGLTMNDCFWLKDSDDTRVFKDVCLRKRKLSDLSYDVSILGKQISVPQGDIISDLSTTGMFPKYWCRKNGTVQLWKTDLTTNYINTKAEILCSEILLNHNINALKYTEQERDDKIFAVSDCIANDDISFVNAQSIKDWCAHTQQDFINFLLENYLTDFANMCVVDYILFNTDRHLQNWGFLVDNKTNRIISFAPLFDHNQALVGDYFNTKIDELIYEPLGITFKESVSQYARYSDIIWSKDSLPSKCQERLAIIKNQ